MKLKKIVMVGWATLGKFWSATFSFVFSSLYRTVGFSFFPNDHFEHSHSLSLDIYKFRCYILSYRITSLNYIV